MSRRLTVLVGALALAVSGCGGEEEPTEAAATEAPSPTVEDSPSPDEGATGEETTGATTGATGATDGAADAATVAVASTELGDVLVDEEGMTLYMFDPDEQGESTCYEQCAQAWPPLVTTGEPTAGEGAEQSMLGVVERDDGTQQVTYNDWPLYYWAQDTAPGDVTGQGVNEVWWVLDPAGEPIRQ